MFTSPILFFIFLAIILFFIPKIYRQPQWAILAIIFLLPFERIPAWNMPWEWGITLRLSQVVAIILVIVFIIKLINKQIDFSRVKSFFQYSAVKAILLYLVLLLVSVIWAIDKEKTFLVFAFTSFTFIVGFLVYYWLNIKGNKIGNKHFFQRIEKVLFYSMILIAIFGLYQFLADSFGLNQFFSGLNSRYIQEVMGFPRVQAFSLEPLFLANYLLIPLGVLLGLFFTDRSKLLNWQFNLAIISICIILILTVSRGGYIAASFLVILLAIIFKKQYSVTKLFKLIGLMIAGIALAFILVLTSSYLITGSASGANNFLAHSSQVESEQGEKINSRQGTWIWAWKAFKEQPILGVGAGNFGPWMVEHGFSGRQRVVNNQLLEVFTETGIVGGLLILWFIYSLFASVIKAYKKNKAIVWPIILIMIFSAFWVQYLSFSTLYIMHFWVVVGLILVSLDINRKSSNKK